MFARNIEPSLKRVPPADCGSVKAAGGEEEMAGSGGSGNPEVGGLSAEQQEKLQHFKVTKHERTTATGRGSAILPSTQLACYRQVQLRNDNERYLKSHPELDVMVGDFLG